MRGRLPAVQCHDDTRSFILHTPMRHGRVGVTKTPYGLNLATVVKIEYDKTSPM